MINQLNHLRNYVINASTTSLLVTLLIMNVVDASFTELWMRTGHATELNPLLALFAEEETLGYGHAAKVVLIAINVLILYFNRQHQLVKPIAATAVAVYFLILLVHLSVLLKVVGS